MIPFAILSANMRTSNLRSMEVSILELSTTELLFRIPRDFLREGEIITTLELRFWQQRSMKYNHVIINDAAMEETEVTEYYSCYRALTESKRYQEAVVSFSRMYMEYVESKLTLSDEEHASLWSDYPGDTEAYFWGSICEQEKFFAKQVMEACRKEEWGRLHNLDYEIVLNTPKLVEQYLECSKEQFVREYFKARSMEEHPLTEKDMVGIRVGNAFCPHLFPTEKKIGQLFAKTCEEQLQLTFVLSPASESFWDKQLERLYVINKFAEKCDRYIAVELNDYGLYCMWNQGPECDKLCFLMPQKGILLYKKKKDVRSRYLPDGIQFADALDRSESALYLPYYQMNTGTFCPLYARVTTGNRGCQNRVLKCPVYCETYGFLYPTYLSMIGKYNSLLGFDKDSLITCERVKNAEKEKRSIVLNM